MAETVQFEGIATVQAQATRLRTDRLSQFRTEHEFLHYGEAASVEDFLALREFAHSRGLPLLILGNGSNVLFVRRQVRAVVVKNKLPKTLTELDERTIEVSSTVMVSQVIKWCKDRGLDSCYYLASVPATVGGAIAMNAGRGRVHNQSIFDFVKSVTFLDGSDLRTVRREEIEVDYRRTPFTGLTSNLIVSAVLSFPPKDSSGDPGRDRLEWSKAHQDHSAANCGSIFTKCEPRLMWHLRGLRLGSAQLSPKTSNWLLSRGKSSRPLVLLVHIVTIFHRLVGRRAEIEFIQVD